MCGRYSLISDIGELARRFEFDVGQLTLTPRYNIAPTQEVLTVLGGEERHATVMRWGLIPRWAKSASIGSRMINARAETVAQKPSFRGALRRMRCLIPANGFYEWQRSGGSKRPMHIGLSSKQPFAFAGLWSVWTDPGGQDVQSCTIVTKSANDLLRPIHERMPVILPEDLEALWLDPNIEQPEILLGALNSDLDAEMHAYEVSRLVNNVSNDKPEVIAPVNQ